MAPEDDRDSSTASSVAKRCDASPRPSRVGRCERASANGPNRARDRPEPPIHGLEACAMAVTLVNRELAENDVLKDQVLSFPPKQW